jgi:hypothetical protein
MAHDLHMHRRMATGLKLVWSSSRRRGADSPSLVGAPPECPHLAEARALVDDWVCAGFECGPAAIEDLVARVASAIARR